jgi:hypothetical protein
MTVLERGRQAFERQAWGAAYELLRAADEEAPLAPEDLERAARAAYLTGRDEDDVALLERTFRERMGVATPRGRPGRVLGGLRADDQGASGPGEAAGSGGRGPPSTTAGGTASPAAACSRPKGCRP